MTMAGPRPLRRFSLIGYLVHRVFDGVRRSCAGRLVRRAIDRGTHVRSRLTRAWFIVVVSSLVAVLGLDAASFAYFSATGTGTGQASVGTLTVTLVATTGTPSTLLLPGGTGDLVFSVTATHSGTITAVTQDGPVTVDATHASAGCTSDTGTWPSLTLGTSGVSVPTQTLSIAVTAPGPQEVHVPGGVAMAATSASACQGATFSIPVTITVQS